MSKKHKHKLTWKTVARLMHDDLDATEDDLAIALAALREIRDLDYRGPRPRGQEIAEDALSQIHKQ